MAQKSITLNWKAANKRQQEQYFISPSAMVARVKNTLMDHGTSIDTTCEIIAGGDFITFHFENDEEIFDMSLSKPIAGIQQEKAEAESVVQRYMDIRRLKDIGYKLEY